MLTKNLSRPLATENDLGKVGLIRLSKSALARKKKEKIGHVLQLRLWNAKQRYG